MWVKHKQSGFTIVELLIVIVVIGILVAITIVAYSGIQSRTRNTQTISATNAYVKALKMYALDNSAYPGPSSYFCLGDFGSSNCWAGYGVNNTVENLLASYLGNNKPRYPPLLQVTSSEVRGGLRFNAGNYQIVYYLEGTNQQCTSGGTGTNMLNTTQCVDILPAP